jgi:alpha-tubulin suppressor-like RCC1 family protein
MQPVFRFVPGLPSRVLSVAAGGFHSVFVLERGQAWSAGTGNVGQLGFWLPSCQECGQHTPDQQHAGSSAAPGIAWEVSKVHNLPAIHAVSAGSLHTLFLDHDGHVWSCGSGKHGRLGLGHQINTAPAQRVTAVGEEKIVAVSAGEMHSLILTTSGRALAFGNNKFGQLGVAIEPFDLAALRYFTGTQSPEPSIPKYSTLTSKA